MRDTLDVRNRFTFDCAEWDVATDELIRTQKTPVTSLAASRRSSWPSALPVR